MTTPSSGGGGGGGGGKRRRKRKRGRSGANGQSGQGASGNVAQPVNGNRKGQSSQGRSISQSRTGGHGGPRRGRGGGGGGGGGRRRRRGGGGGGGGGGGRSTGPYAFPGARLGANAEIETRSGILEIDPRGRGFLRDPERDFTPSQRDPRIEANLVTRLELSPGSEVVVQAGCTSDGYWLATAVDTVDGLTPEYAAKTKPLKSLITVDPCERFTLEDPTGDLTLRLIDLIAPLGKGQRALVVAPPRSGKTVLLEKIAKRIDTGFPDIDLLIMLVNERPEEATHFRRLVSRGKVFVSTADEPDDRHVHLTEMVGARARRLTELGRDVVLIVDSLTRIGRAHNTVQGGGGRTLSGGLDARAMQKPKSFFGAARNIENGGSLTIIATALIDTGSRMDEVIFEEFKGTGNMELVLDRDLADRRIFPAIDLQRSGTRREELLLEPQVLGAVHALRKVLVSMRAGKATEALINKLKMSETNLHFLQRMLVDGV